MYFSVSNSRQRRAGIWQPRRISLTIPEFWRSFPDGWEFWRICVIVLWTRLRMSSLLPLAKFRRPTRDTIAVGIRYEKRKMRKWMRLTILIEVVKSAVEFIVWATAYPTKSILSLIGVAVPDLFSSLITISLTILVGYGLFRALHLRTRRGWFSLEIYDKGWREVHGQPSYIPRHYVYRYRRPGHYRLSLRRSNGTYQVLWKQSIERHIGWR